MNANAMLTSKPSTTTAATTTSLAGARTDAPSESDLTSLLKAWDQAHPTAASASAATAAAVTVADRSRGLDLDLDWRHVLDEIAHPHTTQAFHRLAEAAA
ncbi:hypothetical protein [Streptomyces sp. NBC_01451]|uniref:hypothetical protein n=1 Tax=Streptomyces sp. NBC_01451 TaxID=2903872 RepID=UPI002E37A115|nr:hypothetical protein [Streptomyces sp. NBC_01451]